MKDGLLMIERIIVESLAKKEKNIQELEIDTNLSHSLLLNILPNLLARGIVLYKNGHYLLDREHSLVWLSDVNKKENIKEEAKEIFTSLVNQYFKKEQNKKTTAPQFRIQKMWLTCDEEMILNSHMAQLEGFFKGIKEARKYKPQKEKTCEQRVVIWGASHYSELVDGVLEAI